MTDNEQPTSITPLPVGAFAPRGPSPIDPKKRVALVGFASSSRNLVPYNDPTIEKWSLNHAYLHVPNDSWSRWFEIHPKGHLLKDIVREGNQIKGSDHFNWLRSQPAGVRPIYTQEFYEEIPASVPWPRDEINAWLASLGGNDPRFYAADYYTSTISQMIATAMYDGYGYVEIYGVDLLQDEEYFYQRAGCEYLIGLARGMGIRVMLPIQCALCKASYTYGYTEPPESTPCEKCGRPVSKVYDPLLGYVKSVQDQLAAEKPRLMSTLQAVDASAHITTIFRDNWLTTGYTKAISTLDVLDEATRAAVLAALDGYKAELASYAVKQLEEFGKTRPQLVQQINHVEGQESAFGCVTSWGPHLARGGVINATSSF